MRVLFAASPLIGHVFPMMPLAQQLMRDGHQVVVATGADAAARLDEVAPVTSVSKPMSVDVPIRALALHPLAVRAAVAGRADHRVAGRISALLNRPMLDPVTTAAREFEPDVIVHEPFAVSAAVAAATLDVPAVLHNIGLDHGERIAADALRRLGTDSRVPPHSATLSIAPPSMVGVPGWPMRYLPYSTPAPPPPDWLRAPAARPRILVTRSTMLGDGPTAMLTSVLRAAGEVDAEFVIVRPDHRTARARLPDNVRTVGWTVLGDVLPHCTAMVNHGGAGSVYAALCAGIPQIATPDTGDRAWNAHLVERRATGLAVRARAIRGAHLRELVHNAELARNARHVAAEIAAMPHPHIISSRLRSLSR